MKLTPAEKAERRASFRQMSLRQKLGYILTYYRLPLVLLLTALIVLTDFTWRAVTQKDVPLYAAYLNVTVGEDLDEALGPGFLAYMDLEPRKNEVVVYRDLYLSLDPSTENHQFAYATRMKLLASIQAQELDLVLMNREAYDILSQDGYLLDLSPALEDGTLPKALSPYLTENTVILEDNSIEVTLNEADHYEAVTEQSLNGLDVSSLLLFRDAGFSGSLYLGVIGNSPRLAAVGQYLRYLLSAGAA